MTYSTRCRSYAFLLIMLVALVGCASSPSISTSRTVASDTPRGSEADTPQKSFTSEVPLSRLDFLMDKISKGQASEAETKEFNSLAAERSTVTTWRTEKGEIKQLPETSRVNQEKYRYPKVVIEPNFEIFGQQMYTESDGSLPGIGLSAENLLTAGESWVFVLADDNPLVTGVPRAQ